LAAQAQTPLGSEFTYQGQLKEGGLPFTGSADLRFQLYDADDGGMLVGTNSAPNVPINNGLFTVTLDFGSEAFFGDARWLEIAVYKIGVGYVTLTPRQPITAAPYALYALSAATVGNADTLDGQHGSFYQNASNLNAGTLPSGRLSGVYSNALTLNNSGNNLTGAGAGLTALNASNVSSGTLANARTTGTALNMPSTLVLRDVDGNFAAGTITGTFSGSGAGLTALNASNVSSGTLDAARLPVPLTLSGTSATHIIRGDNASTANLSVGVVGRSTAATGETYGGWFESGSTSGRGVLGWATAGTGNTYGVRGESASTSGLGVYGYATAATGTTYGGRFLSSSTSGYGVCGLANATTGTTFGGRFESASTSGYGVYGLANATSGVNYGGWFKSASEGGFGVYGTADANTGITYGVAGRSASTFGYGVYGQATAATGENYGGCFDSDSTSGRGVEGWAFADTGTTYGGRFVSKSTSGRGVEGWAAATTGTTYGVRGESASTSGLGVSGYATAATGETYGVRGQSASTFGRGVYGYANAATGYTYGGWFESDSTSGIGVYGLANAATGTAYGVSGRSASTSGRGVYGYAGAATGTIYGVFGYASTAAGGYAVYASGDMGASGTKPFRIDHPDDPENKYLLHYAAESPEVINFYSGKATLDGAGETVVELPHYFAKINKDPRYTLTAVGAAMPMLHVAEEIDEAALSAGAKAGPGEAALACSFRIAGGKPGAKVSWEVKAVRNDLWVQKRGTPVEVEKQDLEKGTYQHPELYDQPPEKGMNYEAEHERTSPEHPSHERPDRPADERGTYLPPEACGLRVELHVDRVMQARSEAARQNAFIEAGEQTQQLPEPAAD
jgi:hypothetical protein